jgi:hypothetical protein
MNEELEANCKRNADMIMVLPTLQQINAAVDEYVKYQMKKDIFPHYYNFKESTLKITIEERFVSDDHLRISMQVLYNGHRSMITQDDKQFRNIGATRAKYMYKFIVFAVLSIEKYLN